MSPLMTVMTVVGIGWVASFVLVVLAVALLPLWEHCLDFEYVLLTPSGPVALVPVPDGWEGTLDDIFELPEGVAGAW